MKKRLPLLSFLLVALTAVGCSSGAPAAQPTAAKAGAPAAASPAAASSRVNVDIKDFKHQDITVKVGIAVTWTNQDSARHTSSAVGGKWKSDPLSQGQSFSFTFNEPGVFDYVCDIHSTMKAKVTVT